MSKQQPTINYVRISDDSNEVIKFETTIASTQPYTPPQPTSEQEWEKEFFDKFQDICTEYGSGLISINDEYTSSMRSLIIDFISTQRQQAAEEATRKERERILLWAEHQCAIGSEGQQWYRINDLLSVIKDKIKNG